MNHSFQSHNQSLLNRTKSVFSSHQNNSQINCHNCFFFNTSNHQNSNKPIHFVTNTHKNFLKSKNFNPKKLNKKSLKLNSKINHFSLQTVNSGSLQPEKFIRQQQKKLPQKFPIENKYLSKSAPIQQGFNFNKKPIIFYSQIPQNKVVPVYNSYKNLEYKFPNVLLSQSHCYRNKKIIEVPLTYSINSKYGRNSISTDYSHYGSMRIPNPQNLIFSNRINMVSFNSQNMSSLPISPVKHIIIPQQSQRSVLNSHNPTDNYDNDMYNQEQHILPPPILNKINSQKNSDFLRTTANKGSLQILHLNMNTDLQYDECIPEIKIHRQKQSIKNQNIERDYLQMSLDQDQQIYQFVEDDSIQHNFDFIQGQNQHQISYQIKHQEQQAKIISASSRQENVQRQCQFQQQVNNNQSDNQSSNKPQVTLAQNFNKNIITAQKPSKPANHAFGRYSVQIPKTKKFSTMKVRRTISMKDQQDSSEQQTSQVIYGFRNTHKLGVMDDIAQDMLQSYMTRVDLQGSNIKKSSFRQF